MAGLFGAMEEEVCVYMGVEEPACMPTALNRVAYLSSMNSTQHLTEDPTRQGLWMAANVVLLVEDYFVRLQP